MFLVDFLKYVLSELNSFKDKYLITCGKSFEDYLKDRLLDSVNL